MDAWGNLPLPASESKYTQTDLSTLTLPPHRQEAGPGSVNKPELFLENPSQALPHTRQEGRPDCSCVQENN